MHRVITMKRLRHITFLLLVFVLPLGAQEGIVIQGKRLDTIDKTGTTSNITSEDIEARSDKLLKDVLYQVPGIQISTQKKGTTKFTMRGYDMSQVAILVDGIPIIDAFGSNMDIDNIGLLDISEIIVSRGTCSALYGARGTVGSINLIKQEPVEMYTRISAEYAEHMNYILSVSHGAPVGNFYYYLSASYDKSNGYVISKKLDREEREKWLLKLSRYDLYGFTLDDIYNNPGSSAATYYLNDTGLWDHTEHEKYKISGKAGYHITPSLEIGLSSFYNYTEKKNSTYSTDYRSMYNYNDYTGEMDWQLPDANKILGNMSSLWPEYYDYAAAPYINYNNGDFKIKGNIYYYQQSNTFLAYADPQEHVLAFNRDKTTMTWSMWTSRCYGFNIYPSYKFSSWNKLNIAASFYISDHLEEEQAYNDESIDTIEDYGTRKYKMLFIEAGYLTIAAEDEIKIMKNIEMTLGISYDAQNLAEFTKKRAVDGNTDMIDQYIAADDSTIWGTRDSFNPVAGILYEPVMNLLTLRASVSRKTSFPTLQAYTKTENYYQESAAGRDVKIKPEKSINGNAGFELSFIEGRLKWGTDYFFSRYDDKIVRMYIMRLDDYIYRNMDAVVIHGAETKFDLDWQDILETADIGLSLTYTYIFARNLSDVENSFINKGAKLENLPEHKITFDFRTHFKTNTDLVIFGYFEYNQIQYTMASRPETTDEFSTSYFYAQQIHNPLFIDIKLSQVIYYNYELYVMCRNLLDDYVADPFNPGPGRTFVFGVKAEF